MANKPDITEEMLEEKFLEIICNFNTILKERNIQQDDFAHDVGIEPSYMNKILNAHKNPGLRIVITMILVLELRAADLIDKIPPPDVLLDFKQSLADKRLRKEERRDQKIDTGK